MGYTLTITTGSVEEKEKTAAVSSPKKNVAKRDEVGKAKARTGKGEEQEGKDAESPAGKKEEDSKETSSSTKKGRKTADVGQKPRQREKIKICLDDLQSIPSVLCMSADGQGMVYHCF